MGKSFEDVDERMADWLTKQPVFFVSTAPSSSEGLVNCSPKGNRNEFAVLGPHTVAYLDQTGSGVETIAHLQENGRIVFMFCAFEGPPRIVRLHGIGKVVTTTSPDFSFFAKSFPRAKGVGVRSIIVVEVKRIADSCGYGVPIMSFKEHRPTMDQWASRKGPEGIHDYWSEKNALSIDNLEGLTPP
jgi:hypothetical protein